MIEIEQHSSLPLFLFSGADLPNIDLENLCWRNPFNASILMTDEFYKKRTQAYYSENKTDYFNDLVNIMDTIIENCKQKDIPELINLFPFNTLCTSFRHIAINIDYSGFYMDKHLDNRNVKWTFVMNLDDNSTGTKIHLGDTTISGPTKKGSGVFFFNHHNLWHSVDTVTRNRTTLYSQGILIDGNINQ